ncbi:hypothetical protein OUZ56_006982 [Daphnia magna]|uniref:Uncharacterized protein n=1 Tax=Daphnia magna TaxID=35525 RepID=A0ABQ9YX94_9CRUS|nr:hypothetical protein OUZ56_006982 [Daphnia magna]
MIKEKGVATPIAPLQLVDIESQCHDGVSECQTSWRQFAFSITRSALFVLQMTKTERPYIFNLLSFVYISEPCRLLPASCFTLFSSSSKV